MLGDATYIIWITLVDRSSCSSLIAPFVPILVARFGKKNLYQYCGLFTVVGGVGLFFVPGPARCWPCCASPSRASAFQLINTLMFALEADTVEYGEWKTGHRTEGATYAIFSFTRKITQSIGGALGAFALALGGYITKLAAGQVQPDSAITAIKAPSAGAGRRRHPGDALLHRLPADREEVRGPGRRNRTAEGRHPLAGRQHRPRPDPPGDLTGAGRHHNRCIPTTTRLEMDMNAQTGSDAPILVIMGVSGSGKSTIAALLAGQLGWDLQEGDDLHPSEMSRRCPPGNH